jgi:uncharacterized repeat protein (TIGR04138 family)
MHDQTAREEVIAEASTLDVGELLRGIFKRDGRYSYHAYMWLLAEGLEYVSHTYIGLNEGERRHLTGSEIARGLRALALEQFGPLARDVWHHWGVRTTRDWGEIVFGMIDAGLLHKNAQDRIEDFDDVYDVEEDMQA